MLIKFFTICYNVVRKLRVLAELFFEGKNECVSMARFKISVIIPTYNRSKLLYYSLVSLTKQTARVSDFEVIIGDDGSSDDTREIVGRFASLLNLKYVYQPDEGYRPGSVRNRCLREVEGSICLFIDSGVVLSTNCVAEHLKFHGDRETKHAAIGYVYGFDHDEESEQELCRLIDPHDVDSTIEQFLGADKYLDVRERQYRKYGDRIDSLPAPWFFFWTCHVSVATETMMEIGFFDEAYDTRWGVEDLDLGYRLHKSGERLVLLRSAQAIHYPHGKNKTERKIEGYENLRYFGQKFDSIEIATFIENYHEESIGLKDLNQIIFEVYKMASSSD